MPRDLNPGQSIERNVRKVLRSALSTRKTGQIRGVFCVLEDAGESVSIRRSFIEQCSAASKISESEGYPSLSKTNSRYFILDLLRRRVLHGLLLFEISPYLVYFLVS